jgi:hypothetical protein
MTGRTYFFLLIISISVFVIAARFQTVPGYMDAEYYYLGGMQLAKGEGFTEPILWNYLDDPSGLPHPSHTYWMPLASIIAAVSMRLHGGYLFQTARLSFVLLAIFVPLITATLTHQITGQLRWGFISGVLSIFSGFYLPYITTTDTFAIYLVLGGIVFLLLPKFISLNGTAIFMMGIIAGLMHVSRADGIIWVVVFVLVALVNVNKNKVETKTRLKILILFVSAYLLVVGPWIYRNLNIFGTLLPPGNSRVIWLTDYDQLYSYPASQLTFQNMWQSGFVDILETRFWALGVNFQRVLAEQGMIFLTPLILLGLWRFRYTIHVQVGILYWILTFVLMTFVFPFAGARGGLFHSNAAIQPLFWAITPAGLESFIEWGERKRSWNRKQASRIFGIAIVVFSALLSGMLYYRRVIGIDPKALFWEQNTYVYQVYENELTNLGAAEADIVMVKNPPGYYVENSRPAIVIPDGNPHTLLSAAERYGARYVILDEDHPDDMIDLYEDPYDSPQGLRYLRTVEEAHIFIIQ